MKKHVILIAVIVLVCACAVGLVALAMNSDEPNDVAPDAGEVSDIVTEPTEEITEPITDKPTEPATEPATEAPTEPVTEAPTEPEPATEPETVPPTQPKVDFTYIARDTMLDGEKVEYYKGCSYPEYFNGSITAWNPEFLSEVISQVHNLTDNDEGGERRILTMVVTTFDEYEQLCREFYDKVHDCYEYDGYDSYKEIPEYKAYDSEFFDNNDLIVVKSEISNLYNGFIKNGAELSIKVGVNVYRKEIMYILMPEETGITCFEISKNYMDGIDTLSFYIEKEGNY